MPPPMVYGYPGYAAYPHPGFYPGYGYPPPMPYGVPGYAMPGYAPGMSPGGVPQAPGFVAFGAGRGIPPPAQQSGAQGSDEARVAFRGVRRTIAQKLRESVNTAVHFTVMDEADVTDLDALRREIAAQTGEKISFLPFIAAAVCRAIAPAAGGAFGALNARVDEAAQEIVQYGAVHLGIATDTDSGLMVPVIRDAHTMRAVDLGRAIAQTAASARDRSIGRERLTGSTFTISNVGSHAGRFATPVINAPEVGILAVGKAYDGVVVREGQAVVAKVMPLSLACDHRVVDGATAALCLAEIVRVLREEPGSLM
jgi:pyruvate/2-oxoglutarate dehydrogenase complex dihydrolipoamide acyltransferase (E2) component